MSEPFDPNQQPGYGQPQYGQPQYGQPGYGQPGYGAPTGRPSPGPPAPSAGAPGHVAGGRVGLQDRIGSRLSQRPEPRWGVALAGVGVALAVFGVVVLGTTGGSGGGGGGSSHAVGIVLSLALIAAGYLLLFARRSGPLATAGVAATALGVPVLMGFITDAADAGPSATINVVVLVSLAAWLVSFLLVPGASGHVFYLGAFTVVLWAYLLDKIEPDILTGLVLLPFNGLRTSINGIGGSGSSNYRFMNTLPDFNTVATVSILIGLLYYAAAFVLDRTGRSGPAVAFVVGGLPAMVFGLLVAAVNAAQSVEGILIIIAGVVLGFAGARTLRRFTTWFWSLAVGVGIVVILADVVGDHDTTAGISLIVVGVLLVAAALGLSIALREPDETIHTPAAGTGGPAA